MIPGASIEEVPVSATGHQTKPTRFVHKGRVWVVLLVLLVIAVCSVGGLWTAPAHATTTVPHSDQELEFVWLLNSYRTIQGARPLLLSDTLCLAADEHSSDMGKYKFFDHVTVKSDYFPVGSYPWDRMEQCGYNYYTNMGENIAAGQVTARQVFEAFKASPGHNALMLSSKYKVVGVSLVLVSGSPYGYYWTVDFGGYVDPSAHETGLFQQNDPRLTRLGNWSTSYSSYASYGSFVSAKSSGDAYLASFTGRTIEVVAEKGPKYGKANISIDGATPVEVNFYSATASHQQTVYTNQVPLADGPHTLMIEWDAVDNSTGQLISLDDLRVLDDNGEPGVLAQAPLPGRHEQDEGTITYVGPWVTGSTGSASGGTFKYANAPGAAVNVKFNGTYLAWIAKKSPVYGKAQVSLDGGAPVTIDLYSSYTTYKQKVYNTGLLEDGEHTLSIYWTGQRNAAASACNINVDALDTFGDDFATVCDLLPAPDPAPIPCLYQNTDSRIAYLGPWITRSTSLASGGNYFYTGTKGTAAVVNFTGTSVELLAKKGPAYSKALVTLDGLTQTTVDFHSDADQFMQSVYTNPIPLEYTGHTLIIQAQGPDEVSGGYAVSVDALRITGTMTQAAKTTRIQQTDPMFAYEGSWLAGYSSSLSGGSHRCTAVPGAKVTITFNGTFFAWVAKSSPLYGKASVSVDGGEPTTVDLYGAATVYRKQVFTTGMLEPGTHIVTIECTGEKNPAATGKYVGVDAADILTVTP
jgi:uncharacterized protein YkwD